jgi:hypothetical protein
MPINIRWRNAEQEEKTRQAIQKIIDVTTPKEDQSIKPIWQGSFERQAESMARVPGITKVLAGASEAVQKRQSVQKSICLLKNKLQGKG